MDVISEYMVEKTLMKRNHSFDKQIFIAIDKVNSYSKETAELIKKRMVLKLSKDKLLFNKNWKKDVTDSATTKEA